MDRRGLVWIVLIAVAALAATALVPGYLKRGAKPEMPRNMAAPKNGASFVGTLPASFAIDGGLSGNAPVPGFDLANKTRLRVAGDKVSAKQSREVAQLLGADRLTGRETLTVSGRFDRKTDRVDATVVWTLKGKAGTRLIDWKFKGTLKAWFATATSLKGKLVGRATETDRYEPTASSPQTFAEDHSWEYAAVRGR